jgi:hypothetical protein
LVRLKVLYIWNRAGIDFRQWFKWKENGIYFLSREKENMKLCRRSLMEEPVFRETRIRNEAEIKRKVQPLPKRDEDSSLKGLCGLTDLQKSIQ